MLKRHVTLTSSRGGALRLAVIADTHSHPHADARKWVKEMAPDAILHAGDIGDVAALSEFADIAPVHAVRGNIDTYTAEVPDMLVVDAATTAGHLRILLLHIALQGPRLRADVVRLARTEGASLVVCGHSHVPFIGRDRGVTVFNPGSIGPRRFGLPIVLGAIDVDASGLRLRHIDCESGGSWSPP